MKKLNTILPVLTTIMCCYNMFSQAPDIQWQQYYGGSGFDIVSSVVQTADGGYIMAGNTNSSDGDIGSNHGADDVWITKIDAWGTIQWQKVYGGNATDLVFSLKQTNDGGYIFAGETNSNDLDNINNHGGADCWVVKLSVDGIVEWQKNFGGTWNECVRSIIQTSDGGYAFLGYTSSNDVDVTGNHSANGPGDFWMVKISQNGLLQWQKCFGGFGDDTGNAIMETSDGYFVAVGETWSTDGDVIGNHTNWSADAWVIKVNNLGGLIWQKALGGSYSDRAQSVVEASDGNYIIGASAQSNDGDVIGHHGIDSAYSDFWILALNSDGLIQWQNCLGGFADEFTAMLQKTSDEGYIMAGFTSSSDGDVTNFYGASDYWVAKLNATGMLQWELTLGNNDYQYASDVKQTTDGGYIIVGKTISSEQDKMRNVHRGGIQNDDDYWVVKLLPDVLGVASQVDNQYLKVYPNPVKTELNISILGNDHDSTSILINDCNGKEILKENVNAPIQKIDMSGYSSGIYFLKYANQDKKQVIKIVKQ